SRYNQLDIARDLLCHCIYPYNSKGCGTTAYGLYRRGLPQIRTTKTHYGHSSARHYTARSMKCKEKVQFYRKNALSGPAAALTGCRDRFYIMNRPVMMIE